MKKEIRSKKWFGRERPQRSNSQLIAEDSAGFILLNRQRVLFGAVTSCDASKHARLELVLINLATPGHEIILSNANSDADSANFGFLRVGSSIMLPAGSYRWIARVLVENGGFIKLNRDVNGTHTVQATDIDGIHGVSASGTSGVFCTAQSDNPINKGFTAALSVSSAADVGDSFSAFFSYRDQNSQGMTTPETFCVWPRKDVKISALYMFLDNSTTHRFEAEILTSKMFQIHYSLSVG